MTTPFMKAYSDLLVATCHRRGAFAMGGMAAFIPTRDPETNEAALAKVRADKQREATAGYDGSWVAHPGLVAICAEEFDAVLGDRPNQLDRQLPDPAVGARELLDVASAGGVVTEAGVRGNVSVSLRYLVAWLVGQRRRRARQPDGGRRDRRDLPQPAVAVDPARHHHGLRAW